VPKLKTNSGAKKRFKFTKKGKIKRKRASTRHILTSKSNAQKRRLAGRTLVAKVDEASVKKMMPYG